MRNNLQKLKEKLEELLSNTSVNSQDVLYLSQEIDVLIVEYYRNRNGSSSIYGN